MAGVIMNGVYNHYLTTYAPKEAKQTDTHKRDDLRNIYKSIVKSNQKNPLYLLDSDDHAEADAIDLKEHARALQRTLSTLSDIGQEKPLGSRAAFSSNDDIVDATYIGEGDDEPPTFAVRVEQLAQNQVNTGKMMPNGVVRLAPGGYAFNIRMNEQTYELQYSVKPGDSNRDVQERLARLINKASIGLSADIEEGPGGATALRLASKTTGLSPDRHSQFEITEETDSGAKGTVPYFGLSQVTQEASDARFKINGATHTSSSNHFTVSRTYELNLKRVSAIDEESVIGVKTQQESMIDHVHALVDSYNGFLDDVGGINSQAFRTGKIVAETVRVARDSLIGEEVSSVGISLGDDGRLHVDEDKLHAAAEIEDDQLDEKMKPVRDFAKSLYSMSMNVSLDPMQYITRPVVAYKNHEHAAPPNPYITSEYSGMLFNNYC
ncbi:MAG: flagellar filament capping protein FliD [Lachnospiraceae bacterium]|nr:flagellar filament capping protein FliD [Lachnospiraceae bacterium]